MPWPALATSPSTGGITMTRDEHRAKCIVAIKIAHRMVVENPSFRAFSDQIALYPAAAK
jgi:hypothetical protein